MFCPIIYIYIYTIYSLVLFVRCPFLICFFVSLFPSVDGSEPLVMAVVLEIPERVRCQWYLGDDGATAEHPNIILNMFEAHRIADSQICLVVLISMLIWCVYIYIYVHVICGYIHLYPSNPTVWTDYGNQNHWPHPSVQSEKYQKQNHMFIDHSFFWSLKFYIVHVHYM